MRIHGSICALATPFDADGRLDLEAFSGLIEHQLDNGTQGLVVAGSTGEAHMLAASEFERLLSLAVRQAGGRVPVLAGCGTAATASTIAACQRVAELGADAALVVTPYYVRPDQQGLLRHFNSVADASAVPLVLYNVPSRTACDMQPETVARLRAHPRIAGIKDAVPDRARQLALAQLAGTDFAYLSGDDGSAAAAMLAGAAGTVSVIANAFPHAWRQLCDLARTGRGEEADAIRTRLAPTLDALACAPNPVPIKALLALLGLCGEAVRLPLVALPAAGAAREALRACLPVR